MNKYAAKAPTAEQVRAARTRAGLTQGEAAVKVIVTMRTWEQWESPSKTANRRMHPGLFKLFLITTGQPVPEWLSGS